MHRKKSGEEMVVDSSVTVMRDKQGAVIGQLGIVRDITERRRAADALVRSKADMEALNLRLRQAMMETHHRVKNNLQLIAAMMDIRLMEHPETISPEEYRRLALHVHMLSVVHDILTHEAKDDGEALTLPAGETLERLMPILQQTSPGRPIRYKLAQAQLTARQGSSLALIVNELVSNSIKYGHGEIEVETRRIDGMLVLCVADDGPGFSTDFQKKNSSGTGVELIEHLSRWDLGGHATFENRPEGGALVTVYIPLQKMAGNLPISSESQKGERDD